MKRITLNLIAAAAMSAAMFTSCTTMSPLSTGSSTSNTTTNSSKSTTESVLGSLLGDLIGNNVPVTENSVVGTWIYKAPEVRFESENLLAQAGGAAAAADIETKLANIYSSVGIKPGESGYVFNSDKTCQIILGKNTINGTYSIDSQTHDISIKSSTGLIKLNGQVYYGLNSLALIFDASKLLTLVQGIALVTGQGGGTLGTLSTLLGNYKGIKLGMELQKQK